MLTCRDLYSAFDASRLWQRLADLSKFTDPEKPWTRRAFSPEFFAARQWLTDEMIRAGLSVHTDAAGNLIGRREGTVTGLPPIMTGSHTDTVFEGGRYDGIIGVLAGIEIALTLTEHNVALQHPFEVVDFLSEEPNDFGVSCVGSRAMVGMLSADMLQQKSPHDDSTLADAIRSVGGDPERLCQPLRSTGDVHAFVELHIEQGPVLEREQIPIGVVTDLVGIRRFRIKVSGQADHAGTTPMDYRKDALIGASVLIRSTYEKAKSMSSDHEYVVSTVGSLTVTPNSSNAVPASVDMMLEVRSNSADILAHYGEELFAQTRPLLEAEGLGLDAVAVSNAEPTQFSNEIINIIDQASSRVGHKALRMSSGAGHDAVYLAKIAPTGMIFIPCLNGRSHCPEESIEQQELKHGVEVLLETVVTLDARVNLKG